MTDSKRLGKEWKPAVQQMLFLFHDMKGVAWGRRILVLSKCNVGDITNRHKRHAAQCVCICVCAAAVGTHLITRFCLTTLIRLSATDRLHTLPQYYTVKNRKHPGCRGNLLRTMGPACWASPRATPTSSAAKLLCFLPGLSPSFSLIRSFLSLPSSICVSLSLTV